MEAKVLRVVVRPTEGHPSIVGHLVEPGEEGLAQTLRRLLRDGAADAVQLH